MLNIEFNVEQIMLKCKSFIQQTLFLFSLKEVQIETETFDWSSFEQGLIIGSLQFGMTCTLIPGGILADRFGGKNIIGSCTWAFRKRK